MKRNLREMLSVGSGNIILIDYFLFDAEFGLKFLLKPMPVVLSSYIKCKRSQNLLQPRDRPWLNFILLEEGKGFLSMVRLKIDLWGSPYSRIIFSHTLQLRHYSADWEVARN